MRGKGNRVTHSPWVKKRASVYQNKFILRKTLSLWIQGKSYRKKSPLKETIFLLDPGRYICLICGYKSIRATLLIQQRGTWANISVDISGWIITLAWVDKKWSFSMKVKGSYGIAELQNGLRYHWQDFYGNKWPEPSNIPIIIIRLWHLLRHPGIGCDKRLWSNVSSIISRRKANWWVEGCY